MWCSSRENVSVSFALSGGAVGPGSKLEPGPEFTPPVEAEQPTLRKGDKSVDRWVEYAQQLLDFQIQAKLAEDGDFGNATLAAVLKFQKAKGLQVDGTIGNQTLAALRESAPEKPSTDGRKPHTFVETGQEARWLFESQLDNFYEASGDLLGLIVESVGDTPIDASTDATVRVTASGAEPRVVKVKVGSPKSTPGRVAFTNEVDITGFRKRFPSVPPDALATDYRVEAYLPQGLDGDLYSGKVRTA